MKDPMDILKSLILAGLICMCVSRAAAAPIDFDGNVDGDDSYVFRLEDDEEAEYGTDSFDIDAVEFDLDGPWLYIGVDTVGLFDRDGGPTAFPAITQFIFFLDDGGQDHLFTLLIDATDMLMYQGTVPVPLATGWEAAIGTDLEIRLDSAALLAGFDYDGFGFQGRLDNSDTQADDVITGIVPIPEPASIFLLGVGGLAGLKRRRRAAQQ